VLQPIMRLVLAGCGLFALGLLSPPRALAESPRPKVRAITAFVTIDRDRYEAQIAAAVEFLKVARESFRQGGFEVETIRVATQSFPKYTTGLDRAAALNLLHKINELSVKLQFSPSIGTAMVTDQDDPAAVDLLIDVLSTPTRLNASLVVAADDGIHWNAIRQSARLIKAVSERSPGGQGNFNFAAIAMLKPYGPFFPGAYHLGDAGRTFAVGLEGASVVTDVFQQNRDPRTAEAKLLAELTAHLSAAEAIAKKVASTSGWEYAGIDPTPAPLGDVSIGRAFEAFTGAPVGSPGTMTAAAIVTRAVQAVPVKRVGYSGLMIPVMEDKVLTQRWAEGTYTMDSLLAYSSVCAGGLDTVPLPGDISEERLAQIISDVATLAYKWHKPLAARLLPAPHRKAGELTDFHDSRMGNTTIH
jgi:uncharacterized protein (UPF0210 family)